MNVKKEVYEAVKAILKDELDKCNSKIRNNKWAFEKLTKEQTILKRERVKLTQLMHELKP